MRSTLILIGILEIETLLEIKILCISDCSQNIIIYERFYRFEKQVRQVEMDSNTGGERLVGGELFNVHNNNREAMKKDLLGKLDKLWSSNAARFFDFSPGKHTKDVEREFEKAIQVIKNDYLTEGHKKFGGECEEVEKFYNEWYENKGIDKHIRNFRQQSELANENERIDSMYRMIKQGILGAAITSVAGAGAILALIFGNR